MRGLRFYRRTATSAILIVAASLMVLGAFLLVSQNLEGILEGWRARGQVTVFLDAGVDESVRADAVREVESDPAVDTSRYVGPDDAAAIFRRDFGELGDLLDLLEENPLPPSLAVTVRPERRDEDSLRALAAVWATIPGVDAAQYDLQIIRRLESGVRAVRFIGLLLGTTVLIAALITTANVIRVLVVARAAEIEVMRLVGASEAVVRGRFLFEGVLQGVVGAGVALAALGAAYSVGVSYIDPDTLGVLATIPVRFLGPGRVATLILGGAATGFAGAWIAFGPGGLRRDS